MRPDGLQKVPWINPQARPLESTHRRDHHDLSEANRKRTAPHMYDTVAVQW
jgi:hypothetical protein